ncbi:thioredoxin reductase 2, mitochondrial-like [Lineus longissimus]|uniref:thioredoxin reductase 2, mitochondrial-like n=1 Tax=Lineus longissimus TaxID=88925 RepID=UPI00315C8BDA
MAALSRIFGKLISNKFRVISPTRSTLFRSYCTSDEVSCDLLVVGGGSGGLACAKEAATFPGTKVAVLDYVDPSPQGSRWGLGGTCVNVGCIPKKLMHQAALLRESIRDAKKFGWDVPDKVTFSWETMSAAVQSHVKSLNWGHKTQLQSKDVTYHNAKGVFLDNSTIKATDRKGRTKIIKPKNIVIAVGERPKYPEFPGAIEHCITSDDLFWLKKPPGKTLVIGASYVSLECAGFLTGMGYDTTVMIRSIPLRGFDQQMAKMAVDHMSSHGTKILKMCRPVSVEKESDGRFKATWEDSNQNKSSDRFDTVMLAVGREASIEGLGLDKTDIQYDPKTKKIVGGHDGDSEQTSVSKVYAIGDVLQDKPELTPVAVKVGKLLAKRIFDNSKIQMDYGKIATTVFTPLEYGCVGISEDVAQTRYGDQIEVFHSYYKPLEFSVPERDAENCYIKIVCLKDLPMKILGVHILGPNAGEIVQGFAVAMKCGANMDDIQNTVGIHPTIAEEIVKLHITKRSGDDPHVTGC